MSPSGVFFKNPRAQEPHAGYANSMTLRLSSNKDLLRSLAPLQQAGAAGSGIKPKSPTCTTETMAYTAYSRRLNIQVIHATMIPFVQEGCVTVLWLVQQCRSGLSAEASPVQMQRNKLSVAQQTRGGQSRSENVRLICEWRYSWQICWPFLWARAEGVVLYWLTLIVHNRYTQV